MFWLYRSGFEFESNLLLDYWGDPFHLFEYNLYLILHYLSFLSACFTRQQVFQVDLIHFSIEHLFNLSQSFLVYLILITCAQTSVWLIKVWSFELLELFIEFCVQLFLSLFNAFTKWLFILTKIFLLRILLGLCLLQKVQLLLLWRKVLVDVFVKVYNSILLRLGGQVFVKSTNNYSILFQFMLEV